MTNGTRGREIERERERERERDRERDRERQRETERESLSSRYYCCLSFVGEELSQLYMA